MDQVTNLKVDQLTTLIGLMRDAETLLLTYRMEFEGYIHPWSIPPLANAIGSIQHTISDLKAAKRQIESCPMPDEDILEGKSVGQLLAEGFEDLAAELANPHSDIPTI